MLRLLLDQIAQRRHGLCRRTANRDRTAGKIHGLKDGGFEQRARFDVLYPRGHGAKRGDYAGGDRHKNDEGFRKSSTG